jgi:S1-C subfamily serine protease
MCSRPSGDRWEEGSLFCSGADAWRGVACREDAAAYELGTDHLPDLKTKLLPTDRVTALDGQATDERLALVEALGRSLAKAEPGASVGLRLQVERASERNEVRVELRRR